MNPTFDYKLYNIITFGKEFSHTKFDLNAITRLIKKTDLFSSREILQIKLNLAEYKELVEELLSHIDKQLNEMDIILDKISTEDNYKFSDITKGLVYSRVNSIEKLYAKIFDRLWDNISTYFVLIDVVRDYIEDLMDSVISAEDLSRARKTEHLKAFINHSFNEQSAQDCFYEMSEVYKICKLSTTLSPNDQLFDECEEYLDVIYKNKRYHNPTYINFVDEVKNYLTAMSLIRELNDREYECLAMARDIVEFFN